jgi:ribonuclease H / adenosylcobalamin/alpha-ribazole phosphatase
VTTGGAIWLVRHAPTDWTGRRWCGRADPALQREGLLVALDVAAKLAGEARAGTPVWTSPLRRARQTAAAIGATLGSVPAVVDDLVEVDVGRVEGLTWGELSTREPAAAETILRGGAIDWPGGESALAIGARAATVANRIRAAGDHGAGLVVVSHGAFLHALARELLGTRDSAPVALEAGGILRLPGRLAA